MLNLIIQFLLYRTVFCLLLYVVTANYSMASGKLKPLLFHDILISNKLHVIRTLKLLH